MRQGLGFLFSLLFHAGILVFALYGVNYTATRVNTDRPVYNVDLISLAPPPSGPPVKVQAKAETPAKAPDVPVVEAQPEQAEAKPVPVVEAKPEPKPEPEPEVKDISPKKVEKKTVVKKKEEPKPKPKPEPKPEPKPKPTPKPKPKPEKTAQQLLAEGMAAAKAQAKREEAAKQSALASELAALKKQEGSDVYAHGGQPGGREGGTVGGIGSGLTEVYDLQVSLAIKKNWNYAVTRDDNLLTVVEITIAEDGKILSSEIVESSHNPIFDTSTLQAIKKTEYVTKPPTERDRRFRINFNSQELFE
ncbi:energy transducer TonB [Desulfovibrio caledoniensis]